jgi:hypothetical protein
MDARRLVRGFLLGVFFTASAGCLGSKPEPGVTFSLCALAREVGGKVSPRGKARTIESSSGDDTEEVTDGGNTIAIQVRKTQYGKATFEVTFPDHAIQMVQVKKGESKDVLPKGQKIGVHIEVEEAR